MKNHPALMIQGTTSDAGKSVITAGLCRILARRGIRVAPFKPQNMALNSAVTKDDGEIGRAQAVQAQACHIEPEIDMNPVLIKPNSDRKAQIIVHGKATGNMDATGYHAYKKQARKAVLQSWRRMTQRFDVMLVEGAGSPAEINLRDNDIANMGFAEAVDCPVLLVADIDRGGVFAQIVGTLELLRPNERQRVQGFVINRFRGDIALLEPGLQWLEKKTAKPVLGVLPWLKGLHIEAEDAVHTRQTGKHDQALRVIVPVLPRISNHSDVDVLRLHPDVDLQFIGENDTLPGADLIILPGSKHVRHDLDWLIKQGWHDAILKHLRYGGKLVGLCGGFQMLGRMIHDPEGIEGHPGSSEGLGLVDIETTLQAQKQLRTGEGRLLLSNARVSGYEIHAGLSCGAAMSSPAVQFDDGRTDGVISADNHILGSYLHGLFDLPDACRALLAWAGLEHAAPLDYPTLREQHIERLADAMETHLDTGKIISLIEQSNLSEATLTGADL